MTEERKQELRRLLEDAIHCLEIRPRLDSVPNPRLIEICEYKTRLRKRWESGPDESSQFLTGLVPHISNDITRSRLFSFVQEELAPFIQNDDAILTPSHFLKGYFSEGFPIERLITQLLRFAIARDTEGAVSEFDRCLRLNRGSFKQLALLEGIRLEKEIEVFDGVRLVPHSSAESESPSYIPNIPRSVPGDFFFGKTLLVIDCCISPIFHKAMEEHPGAGLTQGFLDPLNRENPFRVEVNGRDSANFRMNDGSVYILCYALSLTCNRAVQVSFESRFLEESELFDLSTGTINRNYWRVADSRNPRMVGKTEIDDAKHIYNELKENSKVRKHLSIPIDRWIKSHTPQRDTDKLIDLVIALEALYVTRKDGIVNQLCHRASWYLGKNTAHRETLEEELKAIYDYRSNVVHNREPGNEVMTGARTVSVSDLVNKVQCLCRESILKIINARGFPDWSKLRQTVGQKG